jgi:hypothetical protein
LQAIVDGVNADSDAVVAAVTQANAELAAFDAAMDALATEG